MSRPHPLRASWAATKKRLRQEELRRGAQAQAKWDAASAGHLRGRKERELEYRRVCSTSREVCHVNLCEPPQNDRTYVRLTREDLERRTPFDPYERPYRWSAGRHSAVRSSAEGLDRWPRQRPVVGLGIQGRERVTDSA